MARRQNSEPDFDRELFDLPPELRWREWKARVEAVLFAAAKPVGRDVLARVVGRDCALDLLLDHLREDLRGRPIELVRAGEGFTLHTRQTFGPAVRVAFDIPADARQLSKLEAGVLMAVAYFQPVTRGELSDTFGREISRDLIASLRGEGLIAAGPRSPRLGAPYAYVTTEKFWSSSGSSRCATCRIWKSSRTRGFSARRAGMSPDEQCLPRKTRRATRRLTRRAVLPTSPACLVLGPKRTSPRRMRHKARSRGRDASRSAEPGSGRGRS